ncbi:hypothetical protein [Proteiniborus sp. MB09-C3]|uniref:hypothetical protein n=1 Tax=Proteiniborus sp. MB09-C3 TaxID=3050072 RepID=UPI002552BCDA|nr:hypothetical protein [Proteiniborus sp. MB09-C3]WIV13698.1 hypothetical protein QO263_08390 [Proteiniborus sp. MB09-C3]
MKRVFLICLCILLSVSTFHVASAVGTRDLAFEMELALNLKKLGLFKGVGENENGETVFELERKMNRVEALVMLVRALGKGAEAEKYPKTHPFTDVPAWADGYVSYAYDERITKGVSSNIFGIESDISLEMYLTFMLRALGYNEGEGKNFVWTEPWISASVSGIFPVQVQSDFLRGDAVTVTTAALYSNLKDSKNKLHEKLIWDGVFSLDQFQHEYPVNPLIKDSFYEYESYKEAIIETEKLMTVVKNKIETEEVTILHGVTDTPHGQSTRLYLVYKDNSEISGSIVVRLPLPTKNFIGETADVREISLSEDGLVLNYSSYFEERLVVEVGTPNERVIHEAGTYSYTTVLETGITSLVIIPK